MTTKRERAEFLCFCMNASASQLINIYEKESEAAESLSDEDRATYAEIARGVAEGRGISLDGY